MSKKQKMKQAPLSAEEVKVMKAAKKIMKRLSKKAQAWDQKLDSLNDDAAILREADEYDAWADWLMKHVGIDFDGNCDAFVDLED